MLLAPDGDTDQCVFHHPASFSSRSCNARTAAFGFTRNIEMPTLMSHQVLTSPIGR